MVFMTRNKYYAGPVTDHFDGTRFFNPGQPSTDRSLRDLWRWRRTSHRAQWPDSVPIITAVPEKSVDALRITMVGHATVLIQAAGLNILTDPVWSERASPLRWAGPKRVNAPGVAFENLPPIDALLISHNHYDHLDLVTLRRLQAEHNPLMIMPLGNDHIVKKAIPQARILRALLEIRYDRFSRGFERDSKAGCGRQHNEAAWPELHARRNAIRLI